VLVSAAARNYVQRIAEDYVNYHPELDADVCVCIEAGVEALQAFTPLVKEVPHLIQARPAVEATVAAAAKLSHDMARRRVEMEAAVAAGVVGDWSEDDMDEADLGDQS
jgi:hypothetical protein